MRRSTANAPIFNLLESGASTRPFSASNAATTFDGTHVYHQQQLEDEEGSELDEIGGGFLQPRNVSGTQPFSSGISVATLAYVLAGLAVFALAASAFGMSVYSTTFIVTTNFTNCTNGGGCGGGNTTVNCTSLCSCNITACNCSNLCTDGTDGTDGTAATITVGTTTTLAPGSPATVVNVGTSSAAILDFGITKGDVGTTGPNGTAATVAVGTTTTLSPGSLATVVNVGTSSAAILNFGITKGDSGTDGTDGTAATITVGNTTTLSPGSPATVVNVGTSSAAILNFGITQGDAGTDGADGTAATIAVGTVTTLAPGSPATVTNVGTSSAAILDFGITKGDAGTNGMNGAAATIAVGTVTTLAPGSPATVTNVGTSSAAIFDFGLTKGDTGATGTCGGCSDITASALNTTGASVNVSVSAPPTTGQVLTATSPTTATWQTPSAASGDVVGPASAATGNFASFNGPTGKLIQDSLVPSITGAFCELSNLGGGPITDNLSFNPIAPVSGDTLLTNAQGASLFTSPAGGQIQYIGSASVVADIKLQIRVYTTSTPLALQLRMKYGAAFGGTSSVGSLAATPITSGTAQTVTVIKAVTLTTNAIYQGYIDLVGGTDTINLIGYSISIRI